MTSSTTNLTNRRTTGTPSTTVQVFSVNDLPAPSAGVITLNPLTAYQINGIVDVSPNTIKFNIANTVFGIDPINDVLTSDTIDSFLVGVNDTAVILNLSVSCPNGTALDFKNTAGNEKTSIFSSTQLIITTNKIGIFENMRVVAFFAGGTLQANDGITLTGSQCGIYTSSFWNITALSGTNIAHDFGTSVFDTVFISSQQFDSTATSIWISGLPNSGNIVAGGMARVLHNSIELEDPTLIGIDPSDDQWFFFDNNGIENSEIDTRAIGLLGSTSGTLSLFAAASVTDYTITFPPAQGATNEILKLDSGGELQWVIDSATVSLQDAYDDGQNITTTTALGPIVLDNTGSTRAALTITPGTVPTTSLVSGQIYSDGNDLYVFDSVRGKFLSGSERFGFGLNGAADNEYMRVGHASATDAAWIVPYDATITHITAFATAGQADKGFEIQDVSGTVLVSFNLVTSEFDGTQNVDIPAGTHLRTFIVALGGTVSNSAVSVFIRRRV